jgi:uncharacterized repeat protein (TIGR03803 family)
MLEGVSVVRCIPCLVGLILMGLPIAASSQTETVLYNFPGSPTDGFQPAGGLVLDGSGNLYGTTTYGGYGGSPVCLVDVGVDGCGTVFELVKSSGVYTENLLYTFMGTDGAYPFAGLTRDSSGNLYGTTLSGGACGHGTVFELVYSSETYTEKVLYSFGCTSGDGWAPYAGLIMDAAGNLYGTTERTDKNSGSL